VRIIIKRKHSVFCAIMVAAVLCAEAPLYAQNEAVGQSAPISHRYLEYVQASYAGLTQTATEDGHGLGYIPPPMDINSLLTEPAPAKTMDNKAGFPTTYDLRNIPNKVPPIRNQGSCGSCWAFGALGSLEMTLRPTYWIHCSENNMKNCNGFNWSCCGGGNHTIAAAYLAAWKGPIDTADDPYTNDCTCHSGLTVRYHVQKIDFLPDKDKDQIKQAIMDHGAVSCCITVGAANDMNYTTGGHYTTSDTRNHIITLIGWDDNYSASNFLIRPPGNGAWLVRNSWGDWGPLHGYMWVSYYDASIATAPMQVLAETTDNYNRIYQYDPLGWVDSYGYGSTTAWFANVFTAAASDQLSAVAWWSACAWATYEIRIYLDPTSGPLNSNGPVIVQTGQLPDRGFDTVRLNNPVQLTAGHKFSIVVKLTTPQSKYPVPIEDYQYGYTSGASANAGESFVSSNGTSWTDATTVLSRANVCLKGYTNPPSTGSVSGTVTNAASGDPVSGASVSLSSGQSAVTNVNGVYTISGVVQGTYTVTASMPGFVTSSGSVTVVPLQTATCNLALSPLTGGGTVTGVVLNSATGVPIPDATVRLSNGLITSTGPGGSFTLTNVPAGNCAISIYHGAYYGWNGSINVLDGGATVQNASLVQFSEIIVDNDTAGFTNGGSSWTTLTSNYGYYGSNYRFCDTNSGEHCRFAPTLPVAGTWEVYEWWPGSSASRAAACPQWINHRNGSQYLTPDQRTSNARWNNLGRYDFDAGNTGSLEIGTSNSGSVVADAVRFVKVDDESGGGVTGIVSDAATQVPVAGALVALSSGRSVITNPAGYYYIGCVPAGTHTITVTRNGYSPFTSNSVTVNTDHTTILNVSLGSIADIIIDNDSPGFTSGGSSWSLQTGACCKYGSNYRFCDTNSGEHCTFTPNLPIAGKWTVYEWWPGTSTSRAVNCPQWIYYNGGVQFMTPDQRSNGGQWNNMGTYNFSAGQSGNLQIGTGAGGSYVADAVKFVYAGYTGGDLSGTVTSSATGAPIPGVTVATTGGRYATTNSAGYYLIGTMPAGSYTLTAAVCNYAGASASATVTDGADTTCNIVLDPQAGAIMGRVSDTNGIGVSGATVTIPGRSVTTDSDGNYVLSNIAAGDYSVTASAAHYKNTTVAVHVLDWQTAECDIVLSELPGSITGHITNNQNGAAISGATVCLVDCGFTCTPATTDAAGSYTLSDLPPGTYTVSASASRYLTNTAPAVVTSDQATTCDIVLSPIPLRINDLWSQPDNTSLQLLNKVTTCKSGTSFWVEEPDRTAAIKVIYATPPSKDRIVNITGRLSSVMLEKVLVATAVTDVSAAAPIISPIFMSEKALAGAPINSGTPSAAGAKGLYNVAMLVRLAGSVNTVDSVTKTFYLDDGSGLTDGVGKGVKVICGSAAPPQSGWATVTGVVSIAKVGSVTYPIIIIRDAGDLL